MSKGNDEIKEENIWWMTLEVETFFDTWWIFMVRNEDVAEFLCTVYI
jgi:hypothetical protein